MGVPQKHLFYNRIFHYKPTILGIPHVWKTSYAPLWEVSLTKLMQDWWKILQKSRKIGREVLVAVVSPHNCILTLKKKHVHFSVCHCCIKRHEKGMKRLGTYLTPI